MFCYNEIWWKNSYNIYNISNYKETINYNIYFLNYKEIISYYNKISYKILILTFILKTPTNFFPLFSTQLPIHTLVVQFTHS